MIPAGGGETIWFEPEGDPRQNYIPKMGWAENSDEIWLIQLNRLQNSARMMLGSMTVVGSHGSQSATAGVVCIWWGARATTK